MLSSVHRSLTELGGLRDGHTQFRTGEHSDGWIEKGALFSSPRSITPIVQLQAERIARTFPKAEMLVGAAACGAVLATLVAQELGMRVAYTVKDSSDHFGFHRMFVPPGGSRVVLVEDLIFSGRDLRAQQAFFASSSLRLLGASAWMVRDTADTGGLEVNALTAHPFHTYAPEECPLCRAGEGLEWDEVRE